MRRRRQPPVDLVPKLNKVFVGRAKERGSLFVVYGRQTYIVRTDGARVTVSQQDGRHYGSGLWRGGYVHWENERGLNWRALDRIDAALRVVPRRAWVQPASSNGPVVRQQRAGFKQGGGQR